MLVAPGKSISLSWCTSGVRFIVVSKCSEERPSMNLLPHLIVGKTGLPWVGGGSQIHRECVWFKNLKTIWCIYVHCSYVSINSLLWLWGVSCDHPTSQGSFWGRRPALTPRQCYCVSGASLLTCTTLCAFTLGPRNWCWKVKSSRHSKNSPKPSRKPLLLGPDF